MSHYEDGSHIIGLWTNSDKAKDAFENCQGRDKYYDYVLRRYPVNCQPEDFSIDYIGECYHDYETGWKFRYQEDAE